MFDRARRLPIHYAALHDKPADIREVAALGYDINAPDYEGFRPLHFAAQEYAVDAAAELRLGAEVDPQNVHGNSPLFTAVFNARKGDGIVELLLAHGADPTIVKLHGNSPLLLARLIATTDVPKHFTDW